MELKLRLARDEVPLLLRHRLLRGTKAAGAPKAKRLVSVYYDTADFDLLKNKTALRMRRDGKKHILSVKRAAKGLHAHREWEKEVPDDKPRLNGVDDPVIRKVFAEMKKRPLRAQFVTDIRRQEWPLRIGGSQLSVALDVGEITSSSGSVPVCEAEIELKSGNAAGMYEAARRLRRTIAFTVEPQSKAARGYALAANVKPSSQKAAPLVLDRDMKASAAIVEIARNCLAQIRANEACAMLGEDPEGVHQLRVGLRRLRAAMTALRHHIVDSEWDAINRDLRWIARECGRARDWDVFLDQILPPLAEPFAGDPAFAAFMREANGARDDAYARLRTVLADRRYTDILLKLESWWDGGGWKRVLDRKKAAELDVPVRDFAQATLKRLNKKLHKFGDRIASLSPDQLHHLRIRSKRLRYVGEFFQALFAAKPAKTYLTALEGMQDRLGALNDAVSVRTLLDEIEHRYDGHGDAAMARIGGMVLGWSAARQKTHRGGIVRGWKKFAAAKPFWK